jgi:predicted lipoprotein with Yx(FWY)xxD motif
MQMVQGRSRRTKYLIAATALFAALAVTAAACGGGTSDKDKTATAGAKGGTTPAATSAATKAATAAATAAATKAASTPAAGATAAATSAATPAGGTTGASVAVADSPLGKILVDAKGFTLYTFANDVAGSGKSAAEGLVAAWPPLSLATAPSSVTGATGAFAVFTRADGKTQVTYKGMPLYYFVNDKAAGDTKGDKVGGVWFVAVP